MAKLTEEEILDLQNNLYKLYIRFKKIKKKNDFNLNDIKRVVAFYREYLFDIRKPYSDKDFTDFCNMEDLYFDNIDYISWLPKEKRATEKKRIHDEWLESILKNIDNLSKRYFIFKYLVRLDIEGLVKTGNFKKSNIIISNIDNKYVIKINSKDNNQKQQQFIFNSEKEVENFFRENGMVVKWENVS